MFEAAFLDSVLQPGDRLFTTGMGELLDGFDWDRLRVSNHGAAKSAPGTRRWASRSGKLAIGLRVANGIQQLDSEFIVSGTAYRLPGPTVARTRGAIARLLCVRRGYYQFAALAEHASFRLKARYLEAGRTFLDALPPGPRAFVHVRRGDYQRWTIFGRSPLLDLRYFRAGMSLIRQTAPDTQFILLSDEIARLATSFTGPGIHAFSGANAYEDFGLMTLCDGGVISNSTLSWWGGYFCLRRLPLVSPRGFLAAGLGFEYPVGITTDWMTPIEA